MEQKRRRKQNNVGYIGADALFAEPDMTDETFVACDTDDADNMWVLTITDTTSSGTDDDGNEIYTFTYKLKNFNTNDEYYFTSVNTTEDFTITEIDLEPFLYPTRNEEESEEEYQTAIDEYYKTITTLNSKFNTTGTKFKFLFVLSSAEPNTQLYGSQIYTCFIDSLAKEKANSENITLIYSGSDVFSSYITSYELLDFPSKNLSAIELVYEDSSGLYLYVAETCPFEHDLNIANNSYYQNIYKIKIHKMDNSLISSDEENLTVTSPNFYCSCIRDDSKCELIPILTSDISNFFNNNKDENEFKFCNEAFKISDMYIKENNEKGYDLYATVGCVSYNPVANSHKYFSYSLGGLFKFGNVSQFDDDSSEYRKNYNFENLEVTIPQISLCKGLNKNPSDKNFIKHGNDNEYYLLQGLTQAETDDSEYFAGPRCIIPSGDKLLIIDSGFYGEYSQINDESTGEKTTVFNLKDKRNRIFTYDTKTDNLSLTKVDDSISFDYDYITKTEQETDIYGRQIPVS